MKFKTLVAAAFASTLVIASTPVYASTLSFDFTFTDVANGAGVVTGIISGLMDNATSSATSVQVISTTGGFGTGEYVGTPTVNTFTVSSGVITSFAFLDFGSSNAAPAVSCCSLALGYSGSNGLSDFPLSIMFGEMQLGTNNGPISFAPIGTPLPATLPLFASGLAALGLLGWRRKRKAAAIAA